MKLSVEKRSDQELKMYWQKFVAMAVLGALALLSQAAPVGVHGGKEFTSDIRRRDTCSDSDDPGVCCEHSSFLR